MIDKIEKYIKNKFSFLDEETQNRLINQAVISLKEEALNLKELLQKKEKEDILNLLHKIKGVLLNVGLSDMAKEFDETKLNKLSFYEIEKKCKNLLKLLNSLP